MSSTSVIVRTEEQEQDFALSVALKAVEVYKEKEGINIKDNERRILINLLRDRFVDYATDAYIRKFRKAITDGLLGCIDREGNFTVSYNEMKKYLFNR